MTVFGWNRARRVESQILLIVFALGAATACAAHHHVPRRPFPVPPPHHPVPPGVAHPEARHLDAAQIEHIALDIAARRGYHHPHVRDLKWKDDRLRWEVKVEGHVARKSAKLDLWIDGETGEVLKLKDHASHHKRGHGYHSTSAPPPPHPAHGHRHRHAGVELVFDSGLGLYAVVGWRHHFYAHGHFYRFAEDTWQASAELGGVWRHVSAHKLPRGLAKKHRPGKHHGRRNRVLPASPEH